MLYIMNKLAVKITTLRTHNMAKCLSLTILLTISLIGNCKKICFEPSHFKSSGLITNIDNTPLYYAYYAHPKDEYYMILLVSDPSKKLSICPIVKSNSPYQANINQIEMNNSAVATQTFLAQNKTVKQLLYVGQIEPKVESFECLEEDLYMQFSGNIKGQIARNYVLQWSLDNDSKKFEFDGGISKAPYNETKAAIRKAIDQMTDIRSWETAKQLCQQLPIDPCRGGCYKYPQELFLTFYHKTYSLCQTYMSRGDTATATRMAKGLLHSPLFKTNSMLAPDQAQNMAAIRSLAINDIAHFIRTDKLCDCRDKASAPKSQCPLDCYDFYLIPTDGENIVKLSNFAYWLSMGDQFEGSITLLKQLITKFPEQEAIYLKLADTLWTQNDDSSKQQAIHYYKLYYKRFIDNGGFADDIPSHVRERIM